MCLEEIKKHLIILPSFSIDKENKKTNFMAIFLCKQQVESFVVKVQKFHVTLIKQGDHLILPKQYKPENIYTAFNLKDLKISSEIKAETPKDVMIGYTSSDRNFPEQTWICARKN